VELQADYLCYREGGWRLWVLPQRWSQDLWLAVLDRLDAHKPAKHPQTLQLQFPEANGDLVYLKIFDRASWTGAVKDIFRASKALHSLRQGRALSDSGFHVPIAVAGGEQRRHRLLERSFVLTLGIRGQPLPLFLYGRFTSRTHGMALSDKRNALKRLALEIRRLHQLGFVHGDLVPTNILVSELAGEGIQFFFMDNDRTRRYPGWFPQPLWRRNLVQLNRIPLPGISLQDRIRFVHHYLGKQEWSGRDRRFLRWLEDNTRRRRKECDQIDAKVSFRQLMRWVERNV